MLSTRPGLGAFTIHIGTYYSFDVSTPRGGKLIWYIGERTLIYKLSPKPTLAERLSPKEIERKLFHHILGYSLRKNLFFFLRTTRICDYHTMIVDNQKPMKGLYLTRS
jgi:hypothetical protein